MIKDLEMRRLSWIIQVGPKCSHLSPCQREAEGDLTYREGDAETEQRAI